jgi:CheY-like chemotaxis protein
MAEPLAGIHVVVVEDQEDSRHVFEQALRSNGTRVTSATTAGAALRVVPDAHIVMEWPRSPSG